MRNDYRSEFKSKWFCGVLGGHSASKKDIFDDGVRWYSYCLVCQTRLCKNICPRLIQKKWIAIKDTMLLNALETAHGMFKSDIIDIDELHEFKKTHRDSLDKKEKNPVK